jgi:hypothetical protein
LTTLKIAVFAPMPSASVNTATAVNPPFFTSIRIAYLMSPIEPPHGVYLRHHPANKHNCKHCTAIFKGDKALKNAVLYLTERLEEALKCSLLGRIIPTTEQLRHQNFRTMSRKPHPRLSFNM